MDKYLVVTAIILCIVTDGVFSLECYVCGQRDDCPVDVSTSNKITCASECVSETVTRSNITRVSRYCGDECIQGCFGGGEVTCDACCSTDLCNTETPIKTTAKPNQTESSKPNTTEPSKPSSTKATTTKAITTEQTTTSTSTATLIKCFECTFYSKTNSPDKGCVENEDDRYLVWCNQGEICQYMVVYENETFSSLHRECRKEEHAVCDDRCWHNGGAKKECLKCCHDNACDRSLKTIIGNQWKEKSNKDGSGGVKPWVYAIVGVFIGLFVIALVFLGYKVLLKKNKIGKKKPVVHVNYSAEKSELK